MQSVWEFFESALFRSNIKRATSSIALIVLVQLLVSSVIMFLLYGINDASLHSESAGQVGPLVKWCIALDIAGFLVVAIVCLLIKMMPGFLATKPLNRVDDVFKQLADGHIDWSEDIQDLSYPELSHVLKGFNAFMAAVRQIIEDIRKSGIKIAISGAHVCKAVESAGKNTNQQRELSDQLSISSNDGNIAIREISENAHFVSESNSQNLIKRVPRTFV